MRVTLRLGSSTVIIIIDSSPKSNPWLDVAGKYANDPELDRMLAHIEVERELIDRATDGFNK